jgi:pimeloyl-[acyl-carrier protein] methyl ester esterase
MHFVLLPGLDGTGALFDPIREALERAGHVVTVVAYPPDEELDYASLVERVVLPSVPFVLVGESFSGPVALALAARRPPFLRAVVLVATFARPPLLGSPFLLPVVGALLFRLALPPVLLRCLLVGFGASASLVGLVAATVRSVPPGVLAHRVRAVLAVDADVAARACTVPVLYLRATHDRLVARRCADHLGALIPGMQVRDVVGPHLVLQANPEEAAREILRFVDGLLSAHERAPAVGELP